MDSVILKSKIKILNGFKVSSQMEIEKMKAEVLKYATSFDTYAELFCFIKKNTETVEEFNKAMLLARSIWLDRNKKS